MLFCNDLMLCRKNIYKNVIYCLYFEIMSVQRIAWYNNIYLYTISKIRNYYIVYAARRHDDDDDKKNNILNNEISTCVILGQYYTIEMRRVCSVP